MAEGAARLPLLHFSSKRRFRCFCGLFDGSGSCLPNLTGVGSTGDFHLVSLARWISFAFRIAIPQDFFAT